LTDKSLSRVDRHQKRRNNKRKLLFFTMLAAVFFIILLSLIAFGNNDQSQEEQQMGKDEETEEITLDEKNENDKSQANDDHEESDDVYEIDDDVDVQQVDSADENVIVAYTGNWPPIGTVQEEPHTTNYSDGSEDRIEIKRAVSQVTGIEENDMIEHWVGNDGEQKVVATVSSKSTEEVYQVYLSWIDNEGWQVKKVERIKEYNQS